MAYRHSITNLLLKLGRKIPKNCLIDNKSKSKRDIFYKQPMEALNSVHNKGVVFYGNRSIFSEMKKLFENLKKGFIKVDFGWIRKKN